MNEKNIEMLKARLLQLGFDASVETMLRCNICFMPTSFDLVHIVHSANDRFQFAVRIESAEKAMYTVRYYNATLCKNVLIPQEFESLDQEMGRINWEEVFEGKTNRQSIGQTSLLSASAVLQKLSSLGSTADLLKYKHWNGTVLESMLNNISSLRSEWELAEKFYLFDEALPITFSEAVRFLNSRWMEKQMTIKKKLLVKKSLPEEDNNSGGSISGGKLLSKNPRRIQRRRIDKA